MWSSFLTPEDSGLGLQDLLQPENSHLLERSFTVRFRCLLDNTSGFLVSVHYLGFFERAVDPGIGGGERKKMHEGKFVIP